MIHKISIIFASICLGFLLAQGTIVEEHYFREQIYDHFSTTNYDLWDQRYFLIKPLKTHNTQVSKFNLIFICNQSLTQDVLSCIPPYFDAQKRRSDVNIILLEMRYNGKSQPYSSRFSGQDLLEYQSIQQNIADIATFISKLIKDSIVSGSSKHILVGSDLSGSISTWAKVKYPHLIDGAIAFNSSFSSMSYEQYNKILDTLLSQQQSSCKQNLTQFLQYSNHQLQEDSSAKQLIQSFNFEHHINHNIFLYYLFDLIQKQLDTLQNIELFCEQISNQPNHKIVQVLLNNSSQESRSLFDQPDFVKKIDQNNQNINKNKRKISNSLLPSLKLQCADLGFYKFYQKSSNASLENILFNKLPSVIFKQICETLFDQQYLPEEDKVQIDNGGVEFAHSQTLFINNMDSIYSITFKNCTKEQALIDENDGNSYHSDGVRRCLLQNSSGSYIEQYIDYALYKWINTPNQNIQNKQDQTSNKDTKEKQNISTEFKKNKKKLKPKKVKITKKSKKNKDKNQKPKQQKQK